MYGAPQLRLSSGLFAQEALFNGAMKDRAGNKNLALGRYFHWEKISKPEEKAVMRNGVKVNIAEHNAAIFKGRARRKRRR